MIERLTTLAAVKSWLDITSDGSDTELTRLIDAASRFVLTYISKDSFKTVSYTENYIGNGKDNLLLKNWPVIEIASLGVGGSNVPAAVEGAYGLITTGGYYVQPAILGPQTLALWGSGFNYRAPVRVVYTAGYVGSQDITIPDDPFTFAPADHGQWVANVRVTIDGTVATQVASAPATGEYAVDDWGTYTFAAADVGLDAVLAYNYAPWDIAFAVTQLIGEWYRAKDRIGILSKTLGGQETVTFSQADMSKPIKAMLQPYMQVAPL